MTFWNIQRQFAWSVKSYFLGKNKKNINNLLHAESAHSVVSVKSRLKWGGRQKLIFSCQLTAQPTMLKPCCDSQLTYSHFSWQTYVELALNQYFVHILSSLTDICPFWISGEGQKLFHDQSPWKMCDRAGIWACDLFICSGISYWLHCEAQHPWFELVTFSSAVG